MKKLNVTFYVVRLLPRSLIRTWVLYEDTRVVKGIRYMKALVL